MKLKLGVIFLAALALVSNASAAAITELQPFGYLDWDLWVLSGLLGMVLFLYSLNPTKDPDQLEMDAVVSIMAWIPIVVCMFGCIVAGRLVALGTVYLYSHMMFALVCGVWLILAIINTIRIILQHRALTSVVGGDYE